MTLMIDDFHKIDHHLIMQEVCCYLAELFKGRWIRRRRVIEWPANLTPTRFLPMWFYKEQSEIAAIDPVMIQILQ